MTYRNNPTQYDAIVIGAGPNGLAAAITLARAGRSVLVVEANETVGGGARSAQLTLPNFVHDICSAVHPLGVGSPFFRGLPLHQHGLQWIHPPAPLTHPFDDGTAATLERSVRATGATLGHDAEAYWRLMAPIARNWEKIAATTHAPLRLPRHLLALTRFGLRAIWPARGLAAHSILPLERAPSAAAGLVLAALGHAYGWPIPCGGSQKIADALASYLRSLGGEIITGQRVETLAQLPPACALLFDVTPRQLLQIVGDRLPAHYRSALGHYRYGPGVFKVDWALDGPIPWRAAECFRAATIHIGGTLPEIAESERAVWQGRHAERPLVLLAQQSLFDDSRAPDGKHTAWAYCHVPHGSNVDMTARIEAQIERFAPGFRDRILACSARNSAELERDNPNLVGGDIAGGANLIGQLALRRRHSTGLRWLYLCSASTGPGAG